MASYRPASDALDYLEEEQGRVTMLCREFRRLQEAGVEGIHNLKQDLMDVVCRELALQMQIEEEILHPEARAALPEEGDLLDEAEVEHCGARYLIAQVEGGGAADPLTCARFLVLADEFVQHIGAEHQVLFPQLRLSSMDRQEVGRRLRARKAQLQASLAEKAAFAGVIRPAARNGRVPIEARA